MNSFEKAFASARKSGKKEFSWNGKQYNTKLKEDAPKAKYASTPEKGPIPEPRPFRGEATTSRKVPSASVPKSNTPPVAVGYRKSNPSVGFLPTKTVDKTAKAAPAKEESWRDTFKKVNKGMGVLSGKYSRD